jgi:hypothetical protein
VSSWPSNESLAAVQLDVLGALAPVEVLYEFEGPCIFTARTSHGADVLAYLSEDLEDDGCLRFIVATTSIATIKDLKCGVISVREALERGSLWLVDYSYRYSPLQAYTVGIDQLPEDALPARGTMLWPSLEPALTVRLEGSDIREGRIPAAAFSLAAEIAGNALKPIFEWAARGLRQDTSGRPPEWLRDLYTMPAQRFAFGSLEVAFGQVPFDSEHARTPRDISEAGWSAVREGLAWAVSGDAVPSGDGDGEKWLAILESMRRLAPAANGPVSAVEVWGAVIGIQDRRVRLDRQATKRIRSALTELKKRHEVQLRVFTGRVRDLDRDKLTFILRDVVGEGGDVHLVLGDERLLETALEAYYQELKVNVAARSEDKKQWSATEVEFVGSQPPVRDSDDALYLGV